MVPEQLLAFVGDVRGESRNPIQDGEDREIFFRTGVILIARRAGIVLKRAELRRSGVLFRKCLDWSAIIRDFNVDAAENNLAFEHDRQATLIGGYPNRRFI